MNTMQEIFLLAPLQAVLGWGCSVLCCILNCANRWTQQFDGLYPLRYFFWMWHCDNIVHIPSHAIRVQHV
jgi:hypothetical protein